MRKHYADQRWKEFRHEMLERDGFKCVICLREQAANVTLQVHHCTYIAGRLPWEYSYDECQTLCKRCHAVEHKKIAPFYGWTFESWDDLEEPSGECEYCGSEIRYVFTISHPGWFTLDVGSGCCDNLTDTKAASNMVESFRRHQDRRDRFAASSRWMRGENAWWINQKQFRIQIERREGVFGINVNGHRGAKVFETIRSAQDHIFEIIENGVLQHYVDRAIAKSPTGSPVVRLIEAHRQRRTRGPASS